MKTKSGRKSWERQLKLLQKGNFISLKSFCNFDARAGLWLSHTVGRKRLFACAASTRLACFRQFLFAPQQDLTPRFYHINAFSRPIFSPKPPAF
jgi:hypothetical protein